MSLLEVMFTVQDFLDRGLYNETYSIILVNVDFDIFDSVRNVANNQFSGPIPSRLKQPGLVLM